MRTCPICDTSAHNLIMENYDGFSDINAEIKLMLMFECDKCGHRYLDAEDVNQDWFDDYYLKRYRTDDAEYSNARLKNLAEFIVKSGQTKILDIGGLDGELQAHLHKFDGVTCDVAGVERTNKKKYGLVVLSHTLEHVYDVPLMFERIRAALKKGGTLVVEIPIHIYDNYLPPESYDYRWQHLNKFRPRDIRNLFIRQGFSVDYSEQIADYRAWQCWRIAGSHA